MHILKRKNFWIILACDLVLLAGCYYCAYWLRFDGIGQYTGQYLATLPALLVAKFASFAYFDLYRGMWRFTGIRDLLNVIKGSVAGTLLFVAWLAMFRHFQGISRTVIIADCLLTIMAVGGLRLGVRLYFQRGQDFFDEIFSVRKAEKTRKRGLIVGTGPLAEQLLRELVYSYETCRILGFIENVEHDRGMKIHGVPILGSLENIGEVVRFYEIEEIFIASPDMEKDCLNHLVEVCSGLGVNLKVVPSMVQRLGEDVSSHLRDIRVEDLLARDPVSLDMDLVRRDIEGRIVLITGAGGSIGSELARQVYDFNPAGLILLDNAETPLYRIDMELGGRSGGVEVVPCIGDIRSFRTLDAIFKKYSPQLVYHAAAYKHVPMMERTPLSAANNNIIGTYKLASAACLHHTEKFVMISTDKAVRPTSVMGATKRVAEMVIQTMNGNGTKFAVVRFGNVLGSNGSVVPLFERQIASGGPLTVTHPEVTRYFMTIPEAVMLVLQAGAIGSGGELFLLDMGEPVKIDDLARKMIRLAGLVPEKDIDIEYIGLRPGEKLYEELLIEGEGVIDTAYEKIKICNNAEPVYEKDLYGAIDKLHLLFKGNQDQEAALDIIRRLVPEYGGKEQESLMAEEGKEFDPRRRSILSRSHVRS